MSNLGLSRAVHGRTNRLTTNQNTAAAATPSPSDPTLLQNLENPRLAPECRLEMLPPEIRRLLLCHLDLPGLKSMVRASRVFHEQYLGDRRFILCKSIEATLGAATVEAYAIHLDTFDDRGTESSETESSEIEDSQSEDPELRLLEILTDNTLRWSLSLSKSLKEAEAVSIARSYLQTVHPIRELCADWLLEQLPGKAKKCGRATSTELMRLTRALYRFQVVCHLVDPEKRRSRKFFSNILSYFSRLEPWEVEELFTFYKFAYGKYDEILTDLLRDIFPPELYEFRDLRRDIFPPESYEFRDQRPTTYDLYRDTRRLYCPEGLIAHGLSLLCTVLLEIEDRQHLVDVILQNIREFLIPFEVDWGPLSQEQQTHRARENPTEQDRMQQRRDPMPFRGDGEPDAPPLAWTTLWGGTYCSLYGWFIPDSMRRWGYIFWDAKRLQNPAVMELLMEQWDDAWDGCDARDLFAK